MRPHLLEGRKREERVGELGNVAHHKQGLTDWREEVGRVGPGLDMAIFPKYVHILYIYLLYDGPSYFTMVLYNIYSPHIL